MKTIINGYAIELDVYQEGGESRSNCYIEKGSASGSLELALSAGVLMTDEGDQHISPATVNKIEKWAVANGY